VEWALVGVALVFIGLRGYVRYLRRQKPVLSDYLVVLAWLAFVASCACDIKLNQLGLFEAGKTYEMELSWIGEDHGETVAALKVQPP
jgi:hypothetical protein